MYPTTRVLSKQLLRASSLALNTPKPYFNPALSLTPRYMSSQSQSFVAVSHSLDRYWKYYDADDHTGIASRYAVRRRHLLL